MRGTSITDFRLGGPSHRTAIYGRTGDGKTVLGAWQLSEANFDRMPYYVLDFKGDDLLRKIERFKRVDLTEKITRHPGVYYVRPRANDVSSGRLESFLSRIHQHQRVGLFVDEGFKIPNNSEAWEDILTQGRSLHIPVINLSQRPVWLSRFVPSQADFHYLFPFNDDRDNDTALRYMPKEIGKLISDEFALPKFHSFWFDVERKTWNIVGAAPHPDDIAQRFDERLRPNKYKV